MAMEATYYRNKGHEVVFSIGMSNSNHSLNYYYDRIVTEPEGLPFDILPSPDRFLTKSLHPIYQNNGNFKYKPGTYILSASTCWYRKCAFCVERKKQDFYTRPVRSVLQEITHCQAIGFREIFDDSGTFPVGKWLEEFCQWRSGKKYPKISCNMRLGTGVDYKMMKDAGFRMLLYGIESANQNTLDRLQKGTKADEIVSEIKRASEAGLEPHIAVMFGYPWETVKEEYRTLRLVHYLLRKGYAKTAQASIYSPDGISFRDRAKPEPKEIYRAAYHPSFWINRLLDIRGWEDFTYLYRGIREALK